MPIYIKRYISTDVDSNSITSLFKDTSNSNSEMYALMTVTNAPSGYASRATKFIWDAILETYSSSSSSIIDNLKASIGAGSKKLLELLKYDTTVKDGGLDLSLAIIVVKDSTAYLGVFGEQEIYVHKQGSFINVSQVLGKNKAAAASFAIDSSDVVVLSSPGLFSSIFEKNSGDDLTTLLLEAHDTLKSGEGIFALSRTKIEEDFSDIEQVVDTFDDEDEQEISSLPEVSQEPEDVVLSDISEQITEPNLENTDVVEEVVVVDTPKDVVVERVTVLERLKHARNILVTAWNRVMEFVSPLGEKVGRGIDSVKSRVLRFVDDKYSRQVWYKRIKSKLSTMKLSKAGSAYGMKIDGYKDLSLRGKRFGTLILLVVLIVVVLGGIRLSVKAKEARELHRNAVAVFEVTEGLLKQAEGSLPGDTESAENYVFQATEELKKLEGKKLSIDDATKLVDVEKKLGMLDDRLAKRVWLSDEAGNIETFISTRIEFGSESNPTDVAVYKDDYQNESLFIVDKGLKAVYRVNLYDRKVLKIPDKRGLIKSPKYVDIGVNGVYVFDEVSGVVRSPFDTNIGNTDFEALVGLGVDDLGIDDVSEIAVFEAADHIHFLSPSNSTIYRSNFTGSGYSLPFAFISFDTFNTATDFYGDIAIYALTQQQNGLERFSYVGAPSRFESSPVTLKGLRPVMNKAVAGHSGSTLDNYMYVFEEGEHARVIVFEKPKEGIGDLRHPNEMWLVNEYRYNGKSKDVFKNVQDIVSDYQERYIYILDGTIVWKIQMQK